MRRTDNGNCDEVKMGDLPSWMIKDIHGMTSRSTFSEDEQEDQMVRAGESQQVRADEAAGPDGADEAAGATTATQPDGGQHGKPCPFDVTMANGMPTCTTDQGLVLYGSLMDYASEDGLSMAVFPGFSIPVEVPGLMFNVRKRPAANAEGCVAKKPSRDEAPKHEGEDEEEKEEAVEDEQGGDGEEEEEEAVEDEQGGDGEEEEEEECAEGDEFVVLAEAECEQEAPHVMKKPAEHTDVAQVSKAIRPLQLWLKSRPAGMSINDRHATWRSMSKEDKHAYTMSTKAERGL